MFNINSATVKMWVRLLKAPSSPYTLEQVPQLSNLQEAVREALAETTE